MSVACREILDEHELYPVHEEDTVPAKPRHELQVRYLRDALTLRFPERWVTGEACMYWEEHAFGLYRAPDVLVVDERERADREARRAAALEEELERLRAELQRRGSAGGG